jgi:tetratricopeptide (TPR) repeat protein
MSSRADRISGTRSVAVATALLLLIAASGVTASESAHPSPAAPATGHETPSDHAAAGDTNAASTSPMEIDPALRNSAHLLVTSNLLDSASPHGKSKGPNYEELLANGRLYRQAKQIEAAQGAFVAVLQGNAPVELQRSAMLELALMAQENNQHARAQQIFTQYLERFPDDPSAAEVYLRQGLLYRQMGTPTLALSKFYAVMTTALRLKLDRLEYYQRLVLQAQTEIADTYYLQGKFGEALDYLGRLLKLENPQLNKAQIVYKLIRSLSCMNRHTEAVAQAEFFLTQYPEAAETAEVRFLLADALKKLGRTGDAMQQVFTLLEAQFATATNQPANWAYWQQRTGNEIANQLYKEGDYVNALEVYRVLANLNTNASWQLPVWYQTGLVYERLQQPRKAVATYESILAREKELDSGARSVSLETVLDMARWRKEHLSWQLKVGDLNAGFHRLPGDTNVALSAK